MLITSCNAYLEPVDGAAVDEGGKLAESVAERVPDGTHRQDDVQLVPHARDEQVEQCNRGPVRLLRFVSLPEIHSNRQ